jgi:hypothetical protein
VESTEELYHGSATEEVRAAAAVAWTLAFALEPMARLANSVGDDTLTRLLRQAHGQALTASLQLRRLYRRTRP